MPTKKELEQQLADAEAEIEAARADLEEAKAERDQAAEELQQLRDGEDDPNRGAEELAQAREEAERAKKEADEARREADELRANLDEERRKAKELGVQKALALQELPEDPPFFLRLKVLTDADDGTSARLALNWRGARIVLYQKNKARKGHPFTHDPKKEVVFETADRELAERLLRDRRVEILAGPTA